MKRFIIYIFLTCLLFTSCDKWFTTEDVSHVSYLPEFTLEGGDFIWHLRLEKQDSVAYIDPDVTAVSNGKELTVYYVGIDDASTFVDLTKTGVYILQYTAQNDDGLSATAERIISVTETDVSTNDLTGTYTGTIWDPMVDSKVTKINVNGYYKCTDVMGYPGYPVEGKFVDLGKNKLILLHGNGNFGRYLSIEGAYSSSTLSWEIRLIDPPYEKLNIPVLWRKKR
jgi:hypothetical protein